MRQNQREHDIRIPVRPEGNFHGFDRLCDRHANATGKRLAQRFLSPEKITNDCLLEVGRELLVNLAIQEWHRQLVQRAGNLPHQRAHDIEP
ncbi:MAG: hypothetical protein NTAFB09_07960 [Nitrosospira sp.]